MKLRMFGLRIYVVNYTHIFLKNYIGYFKNNFLYIYSIHAYAIYAPFNVA
mgnify:CR=1 FL=1